MVAKSVRSGQCVTVISAVEYESGKHYFEVNLRVCLCIVAGCCTVLQCVATCCGGVRIWQAVF